MHANELHLARWETDTPTLRRAVDILLDLTDEDVNDHAFPRTRALMTLDAIVGYRGLRDLMAAELVAPALTRALATMATAVALWSEELAEDCARARRFRASRTERIRREELEAGAAAWGQ